MWLADHDLDSKNDSTQITLWSGRGLLSESKGPVWLIGTASEHHVIHQYNLNNASNHYLGLIQTETVRCFMTYTLRVLTSRCPAILPAFPLRTAAFHPGRSLL